MKNQTAVAPVVPTRRRIWPRTLIACGLALTLAWVSLLGYGLIALITRAGFYI